MKIQVCCWKNCKGRFSEYIIRRLESDKQKYNLESVTIEPSPCMDFCEIWPNVKIDGKVEHRSDPAKISKIMLEKTLWSFKQKMSEKQKNT